jgi:NADH-quinone oxidoreductase subunit G
VLQFNSYTSARAVEDDFALVGSAQFATAAKIADGDVVNVNMNNQIIQRRFKIDETLKGTIALNPTFDLPMGLLEGSYRFEKVKIMKVGS